METNEAEEREPEQLTDLSQETEDRGEPDGEIEQARHEGLVQQIQQAEENRTAYVGITEERLREVVEEIQGENHEPEYTVQDVRNAVAEEPQLRRIDLSSIPPGMTSAEYIAHYQQTGNTYVDSNTSTNVTMTTSATDETTYVDVGNTTDSVTGANLDAELAGTIDRLIENGEVQIDPENGATVTIGDTPPSKEETLKQFRARARKENPEQYEKDAKHALIEKRIRNLKNIEKKRETYLSKLTLTSEDIAINMKSEIFHTTYNEGMPIETSGCENVLVFDKNFNLLAPEQDSRSSRRVRGSVNIIRTFPRKKRVGLRINRRQYDRANREGNPIVKKYIILDKGVLIASRGGQFKFRVKNNVKINEILELKKKFQITLRSMYDVMEHLVAGIGAVLPPEDFEIIYEMSSLESVNFITVLMRFRDVNITNSVEISKYLGDIIVKQTVEHYPTTNNVIKTIFTPSVSGQRMSYLATDAIGKYVHSHLTAGIHKSFTGFCTGDQNYMLDSPSVIDIEAHVHRLREFVSWESLEGGPHYKMEDINSIGKQYSLRGSRRMKTLPSDSYIHSMIEHVSQIDGGFNRLSNCFNLVNKNGQLTFILDRKTFYLQVIDMFNREVLDKLSDRYMGGSKYFYKPERDQFYKFNSTGMLSVPQLRLEALEVVMNTIPVYMNGKYIKPTLVDTTDPFEGIKFSPSPELMYELANVIMYHLINKLEEYGNTSKVKEED